VSFLLPNFIERKESSMSWVKHVTVINNRGGIYLHLLTPEAKAVVAIERVRVPGRRNGVRFRITGAKRDELTLYLTGSQSKATRVGPPVGVGKYRRLATLIDLAARNVEVVHSLPPEDVIKSLSVIVVLGVLRCRCSCSEIMIQSDTYPDTTCLGCGWITHRCLFEPP
jgi:hypothetical protein